MLQLNLVLAVPVAEDVRVAADCGRRPVRKGSRRRVRVAVSSAGVRS